MGKVLAHTVGVVFLDEAPRIDLNGNLIRGRDYTYQKEYSYLCDLEGCEPNDIVIVQSGDGVGFARIVRMYMGIHTKQATKWVIQKFDLDALREKSALINEDRRLRQFLDKRLKESGELLKYKLLAQVDPEVAQALERLGEIENMGIRQKDPKE